MVDDVEYREPYESSPHLGRAKGGDYFVQFHHPLWDQELEAWYCWCGWASTNSAKAATHYLKVRKDDE